MRAIPRRSRTAHPFFRAVLGLLLALATAPMSVVAQDGGGGAAAADSVRTTMMSLAAHYQGGDLEAAGRIFADGPGVHIIEGTGVNHGWVDYRDHHLAPELESFENGDSATPPATS